MVGRVQRDGLLDGLNPAQRRAVITDAAPLAILAGAGSGKTRVLTRRIAHRVHQGTAEARHVLALTFTRKAAGELTTRLRALGVRDGIVAGTFHAVAYGQLRRRWADRGEPEPALLDRKVRLIVPLLPRRAQSGGRGLQAADVAAEIEWAKARMVGPERYAAEAAAAGRTPPAAPDLIASLFDRYETEKRRRGVVDFDDLLLRCADALHDDREFAASQRWRFRHLFVDEFQDVNPVQCRLLDGWRGERPDLCVVGDPNQAIYAWNGADPRFLTDFREHFGAAEIVRLDDNYRSSPQVLTVANAVLGSGLRDAPPLKANRPDGPLPTVSSFDTDRDEATQVARAIRRRQRPGRPWSHMAVLARTNAQLLLFEEAMRTAGIPFRVRGGKFLSQPEVRHAMADLRRRPSSPLAAAMADLQEIIDESAAAGDGPAADRARQLEGLLGLARELAVIDPGASVAGFLSWLAATASRDDPGERADAVELATFHAAKGLEWPVVFLTGLERGLVPIGHADDAESRAEERRLLYVAVTRAEEELHCSWAERRTFGTRTSSRVPSPWLAAVEAAIKALESGGGPADWRRFLDDNRAKLRSAAERRPKILVGANADPVLLSALKAWRATTAKASGMPAYVIFHDTTLAALAEARPSTIDGLLAIPGLGPVKTGRYGDALLALLAEHAATGS
ncbi:MAG: UvrD/REP helicase [Acidimicrobiales bacterium]|nr:UvrD/REP helicase [Acidimicrobiales bacterium]